MSPLDGITLPRYDGRGFIYLLHFDPPYVARTGQRTQTARHYRGWAATKQTLYERIDQHLRGSGSPLVRAAIAAGCDVLVSEVRVGDRNEERRLKNMGSAVRTCPHRDCRGW